MKLEPSDSQFCLQMAGRVATVTAFLLLVVTRVSGGGQPFFYTGAPAPVVPQFYVYQTPMVAVPVVPEPARRGSLLPCPSEGFYPHPINCSRFYRCVDYAGTGQFFSRYEFQCPQGQMFLSVGKDTCVPGDCAGVVPLPAPISGDDPDIYGQGGTVVPSGTGTVGDDPGSYPGSAPQPIDSVAPGAGGAYPQPGGSPSTEYPSSGSVGVQPVGGDAYPTQSPVTTTQSPAAYPQPGAETVGSAYPQPGGATGGAQSPSAAAYPQPGAGTGGCVARYVQDPTYCNIYHRCPDDSKRYLCTAGTVFDQARQMCRLNDQEDVCAGKPMYSPSAAFRADFPQLNQGGPAQPVSGQTFPLFSQGQTFPLFSREQTFPLFSQGQTFPSFSQEQSFPSFDQIQTFQSFDQAQNFPATQRLGYTAQIPYYIEVGGVPQFEASNFVNGQDPSFYAQPSYVVPNYHGTGK